ncbi:MAG: hypothetical protein QOH39_2892 [Verrucomicrobiota bacterium]|jgi:glycosyltransferase involved in cell wall biosynthesis
MKVLLINDYSIRQGGAEILILNLRDGLRRLGHDARLFTSSAGENNETSTADYTCLGTTSSLRTLLQSANPWAHLRLRRVLTEFQPDVVHVKMFLTQLSPLILPLLRKIPALYHVVWYRPICPLGTKMLPDGSSCYSPPGLVCYRSGCLPLRDWVPLMFQMKLWRRWRGVFDLIVANSAPVKRRLLAEGIAPVEVVGNGVSPHHARTSFSQIPTVAFAGRLVPEKGVDVLVRAFAAVRRQLSAAKLIICGEGPERPAIEQLVSDLGLTDAVSMPGHRPNDEVARIFEIAWVVAVPSIWEEPFGQVAIEAMMIGVAVVASAGGGLTEIVRDGQTGFLVPPHNPDALAAALLRILGDAALAEKLGRAGNEVALAEFNQDRFVDHFVELYRSIQSRTEVVR